MPKTEVTGRVFIVAHTDSGEVELRASPDGYLQTSSPVPTAFFDADADNTVQIMKDTPGVLSSLHIINSNDGVDAYIQFFNQEGGGVTLGSDTPYQSYLIPAGAGTLSGAFDRELGDLEIPFDIAISYAVTTTATGSSDPTTGLVLNATFR